MGSYDRFSVLVLWKVRENSLNLCTFSLLLEKPNYKNPRRFLFRFEHTKFVLIIKWNTVSLPYLQRNFILKCCHDLCVMLQIMHRVYLQYLYHCIIKFKSVFFTEIIGQILYTFLNYTQLTWAVAEKMPLYNVHKLQHRAQVMTTF